MANTKVALQLRIRLSDGKRVYGAPAFTSNGKLKPRTALVNGTAEHRPESVYVLRYREDGRLIYRQVEMTRLLLRPLSCGKNSCSSPRLRV